MNPFLVWLSQLAEAITLPAAWGIFLAGAAIYLINEWRIRFLVLVSQYLFVGLLFMQIFDTRPELAMLKIIVGWMICGAFLISAYVRERSTKEARRVFRWASNLPFRILSLTVVTVVAYLASQKYALPFVSADLALACFILIVLAVLFFGTEENDALIVGVGVLNLLAALDIFYSSQDPGLLVTGLLVMVNLLVGLAVSYLAVVEVSE